MADRNQLLNDGEEAFRIAFEGKQVGIWTAIPGIVFEVDLVACTCTVQPAITASIEDENGHITAVKLPLLVNVPIVFPGAGDFVLTFPLNTGDEVLVIFASRCIDAWWQSGGVQAPMEARMHDLSDGFAFPSSMSQAKKIENIDGGRPQLRNRDGDVFLELTTGGVRINGNLNVTGNIVTDTGDVFAGDISLKEHTHPVDVPVFSGISPTGETAEGDTGTPE